MSYNEAMKILVYYNIYTAEEVRRAAGKILSRSNVTDREAYCAETAIIGYFGYH